MYNSGLLLCFKDISRIDKESEKFRYPTDKNINTYFMKSETLDIMTFASFIHELCKFLDAVDSMLSDIMDFEVEMHSYYAADMSYYDY